jgi:hypothetical protein
MPHLHEAIAASHDRHDTLLVAALAAGDLADTDRDPALALTATCADCATLHADLVAIARATATLPPPISAAGRDFRLTPAQAADLRRTGWRRFLPSAGSVPLARPLGAALATFGIAGLLIGTQPLGFVGGSATSAPSPAGAAAELDAGAAPSTLYGALAPVAAGSAAAASAAAPAPQASAAASIAPGSDAFGAASQATPATGVVSDAASPQAAQGGPKNGGVPGAAASAGPSAGRLAGSTAGGDTGTQAVRGAAASSTSPSVLVLISLAAFVVGVLLVVTSYRGRRTSL